MRQLLFKVYLQNTYVITILTILILCGFIRWYFTDLSICPNTRDFSSTTIVLNKASSIYYRRDKCSCTRPIRSESKSNILIIDETKTSLCSQYSTLRGSHQRIIAISMYGPKENRMFSLNKSVNFLHELINDTIKMYPGWILRVYHDVSITEEIICPIECRYNNVDFCNASALGHLGSISDYIPPKIWRFLPAGDLLVDIAASRDLDSPLLQREIDAVNQWLSTNKSWHVMRDHPLHTVPILGGLWSFRSVLNRAFANILLEKMLNRTLINRYGGRGDQTFLSDHVWPYIQNDVIAHDSYLCTTWYGKNSQPWPTRRLLLNGTGCFVGCVRPCCPTTAHPYGECPIACRPKNHTDWTTC